MFSITSILSQKIGEIQSRLPSGIGIGNISRPRKGVINKDQSDIHPDSNLGFEDILEQVLKTHRVNPPTHSSYSKDNISPYIGSINNITLNNSYNHIINDASLKYDVPANIIRAVIKAESNFNPNAVSSAGAMGLMQLMPATAKGLGVEDAFNPEQNIDGGVRYIRHQLDRFDNNLDLALAAYNWGPNNIIKNGITDLSEPEQFKKLPKETQNYIQKIRSYLRM